MEGHHHYDHEATLGKSGLYNVIYLFKFFFESITMIKSIFQAFIFGLFAEQKTRIHVLSKVSL